MKASFEQTPEEMRDESCGCLKHIKDRGGKEGKGLGDRNTPPICVASTRSPVKIKSNFQIECFNSRQNCRER